MRTAHRHLLAFALLATAGGGQALGQTVFPGEHVLNDVNWTNGTHRIEATPPLIAPGSPSVPVWISGSANVDLVSAIEVRLTDGFHAGGLDGTGRFRAWIDSSLGTMEEVLLIAPDPATSVVDGLVHVDKWEKLEIAIDLSQAYRDAIARFFGHYYSNGVTHEATPDRVDATHDLNPYADDSLQLVMTLTTPSGTQTLKWGFFMKEGTWASGPMGELTANTASALHPYNIRFRMAPDEEGTWGFALSVQAPFTADAANVPLPPLRYPGYTFVCDPPLPDNKGPLSVNPNNRRMLWFEASEEPFFALGTNMPGPNHEYITGCGQSDCPYKFYQRDFNEMHQTMRRLHEVGGNYVRMMASRHVFAPEWVNAGVYDAYYAARPCSDNTGLSAIGNCQFQCWAFDRMLDTARVNNLYIQLCIDPAQPSSNYEDIIWGNNAYVNHFLEPARDSTGRFDMKGFFYRDGDPANTADGVFYYWKRKYKYMMARWGYAVNLAVLEPFNEVDGLLTYREEDRRGVDCCVCPENRLLWKRDTLLPGVLDRWLTDVIGHVRGPVDLLHPTTSPLGESDKLVLMSYAERGPLHSPMVYDYYRPFTNPKVDLIDTHYGIYQDRRTEQGQLSRAIYDAVDDGGQFRNAFPYPNPSLADRKPFNQGEFQNYTYLQYGDERHEIEKYFHNYDVSFHNELWSSAFSGKFAAGTTWQYERVFWWPDALRRPPQDFGNHFQINFLNSLGATNTIDIFNFPVPIANRTLYHHFKPLADFLTHPSWTARNLFSGDYSAHKAVSSSEDVEIFYLKDNSNAVAIGWVHNRYAAVLNTYYLANSDTTQNFFGCSKPIDETITLNGLLDSTAYHITWFSTHLNDTIHPSDTVQTSSSTGTLDLDLSSAPLGDTIRYYLDTLHADYAFMITPGPLVRNRFFSSVEQTVADDGWDFDLYPNPTRDMLFLRFSDGHPKNIAFLDAAGREVLSMKNVTTFIQTVPLSHLATGVYQARVSRGIRSKTKKLVIH